jgi:hypothetical protein
VVQVAIIEIMDIQQIVMHLCKTNPHQAKVQPIALNATTKFKQVQSSACIVVSLLKQHRFVQIVVKKCRLMQNSVRDADKN